MTEPELDEARKRAHELARWRSPREKRIVSILQALQRMGTKLDELEDEVAGLTAQEEETDDEHFQHESS